MIRDFTSSPVEENLKHILLVFMCANLWEVHHASHGFYLTHLYRMISNFHQKRVPSRLLGRGPWSNLRPPPLAMPAREMLLRAIAIEGGILLIVSRSPLTGSLARAMTHLFPASPRFLVERSPLCIFALQIMAATFEGLVYGEKPIPGAPSRSAHVPNPSGSSGVHLSKTIMATSLQRGSASIVRGCVLHNSSILAGPSLSYHWTTTDCLMT